MPRLTFFLLAMTGAAAATAQTPTNVEVLSELAIRCIPEVPADTVSLSPPSRLPFLRGALAGSLQEQGLVVLAAERPGTASLSFDLSRAGVNYSLARGGMVNRNASLALAVRLVSADSVLLHDELCAPEAEDQVRRDRLELLEEPAYPETRSEHPLSFWRRAVQPVVIAAATAAGTILFFSLRSRRTDGS